MDDVISLTHPGTEPPDAVLIERFLAGECTADEERRVHRWAGMTSSGERLADIVRTAIREEPAPVGDSALVRDALWLRLQLGRPQHTARTSETQPVAARPPRPWSRIGTHALRPWLWPGLAAAAIGAVLLFALPRGPHDPGVTRTYTTSARQRATWTLDDGSRVTLAPSTTIRLVHFGARSRSVVLDGEAYFEVPRAAGVPFVVRSGTMTTRVLGTAFVVRHYADDVHARITVVSGKVGVSSASKRFALVTLTARHAGDVTDSTVRVMTVDDLAPETGWVNGKLVFRNTPLTQVLATLSRWYGYTFRFADPALEHQNVTVGLSTESSAAALSVLKQILGVDLTVAGDTVTLTAQPSRPRHGNPRNYDIWTPTREVGR